MSSTVHCPSLEDTYRNSQRKDPCEVAFDVLGNPKCATSSGNSANDLQDRLQTIVKTPSQGPESSNPCFCSTPLYNLVSFCVSCQHRNSGQSVSWSDWIARCNINQPGEMLRSRASDPSNYLPIDTTILDAAHVPKWANEPALYNDTGTGTLTFQLDKVDKVISLVGPGDFPLPSESNSSTPGPSSPVTPIPIPTDSPKKKGPNVGAIAGGIIGGVVFLAAIGLFFLCWRRRKNKVKEAPSAAYMRARGGQGPPAGRDTPVPLVAQTPYVGGGSSAAQEKARLAEHEREREREEAAMMAAPSTRRQGTHSTTDSGSFDTPLISEERRNTHLESEDSHAPPSFKSRGYHEV